MQNQNSKDWPEVYSCRFLEAGIVSYEDSGAGIAYLPKEVIDDMASTFIGRPVIIQHKSVNPDNYKVHAVGYVINVKFNPEDGWYYADFIITDDEAKKLIESEGYSVSCAYNVLDAKEGGLWHDIKYDGEITKGSFTHLALVESPRYEGSKISKQLPAMLVNGKVAHIKNTKEEPEMQIFKLFNKKENNKPEDIMKSFIELETKAIPISDVLHACLNGKKLDLTKYEVKNDKQSYMAQDHDIVDINGKTVSIGELKANYAMKTNEKSQEEKDKEMEAKKKNEKEDEDKKKEEEAKNAKEEEEKKKKEDEAKNEKEEEEKEKKDKEEKENAKKKEEEELRNAKEKQEKADAFFAELQNAASNYQPEVAAGSGAGKTRTDRANEFRNRTTKNKS